MSRVFFSSYSLVKYLICHMRTLQYPYTSWATIRTSPGTGASGLGIGFRAATTDKWVELARTAIVFDCSTVSIADVSDITVAALWTEWDEYYQYDPLDWNPDTNVYGAHYVNDEVLEEDAAANFTLIDNTPFSSALVIHDIIGTHYVHIFTLNSGGVNHVFSQLGGYVQFGLRDETHDVGGASPPWASWSSARMVPTAGPYGRAPTLILIYLSAPEGTNYGAQDVTTTTANFLGQLDDDGELTTQCRFHYGETLAYGSVTPWQEFTQDHSYPPFTKPPIAFNAAVIGLTPDTKYYMRVEFTNSRGTFYTVASAFWTWHMPELVSFLPQIV
jgi:hypothetical protein